MNALLPDTALCTPPGGYVVTPGPWYSMPPDSDGGCLVEAPTRLEAIAYVYRPDDAPLIAAAPLLLIAIDDMIAATIDSPDAFNRAFAAAKTAAAIARGAA